MKNIIIVLIVVFIICLFCGCTPPPPRGQCGFCDFVGFCSEPEQKPVKWFDEKNEEEK